MVSPVTDPALLAELNGGPSPVTDPSILAFLNGGEKKPKGFLGSVRENVEGVLEPALTLGTGFISSLAAAPMAAGGALYEVASGNAGKGFNVPEQVFDDVLKSGTYQPRSELGKERLAALGRLFQSSKIPVAPQITGGVASAMLPNLARGASTQVLGELSAANAARNAKALTESRINAPKINAVRKARELNYVLPPTAVEEGGMRSAYETLAGRENVVNHASLKNQPETNAAARQILGVDPDKPLVKATYDEVAARTNLPYEQIAEIPVMPVDKAFGQDLAAINSLSGLQPEVQAIVRKSADAETLLSRLNSLDMLSGEEAVRLMDELRSKANSVGMDAAASEKALAAVQKSAARSIEGLVERNLAKMAEQNPQYTNLLNDFRQARTTKAQMHILRKATNLQSGNVNAAELGRRAGKGVYMTGKLADIAEVASQFPQAFRTPEQIGPTSRTMTALTGGLFGAAGASIGGTAGALIGPLAWHFARSEARKTALSPRMQRSLVQSDARPLRERMGYGTPEPEPVSPLNPVVPQTPLPELNVPLVPGTERIPPQPITSAVPRAFRREGELPAFQSMPPDELTGVMTRQIPNVRQQVQPLPNISELPPILSLPQTSAARGLPVMAEDLLPYQSRPIDIPKTNIPLPEVPLSSDTLPLLGEGMPKSSGTSLRGLLDELGTVDTQPIIGEGLLIQKGSQQAGPRVPASQAVGQNMLELTDKQIGAIEKTWDARQKTKGTPPPTKASSGVDWDNPDSIKFMLRQEAWQQPEIVAATEAFIREGVRLNDLIKKSSGFWQNRYRAELMALEDKFAEGAKLMGGDRNKIMGLQNLYESGSKTMLPIEKTRGLLD